MGRTRVSETYIHVGEQVSRKEAITCLDLALHYPERVLEEKARQIRENQPEYDGFDVTNLREYSEAVKALRKLKVATVCSYILSLSEKTK